MGTAGLVSFYDGNVHLVSICSRFDSYPSSLGLKLKTILNNGNVIIRNGYFFDDKIPVHFNGIGCLAAYVVGKLKGDNIGNYYIVPPTLNDYEYFYSFSNKKAKLYLSVTAFNQLVFDDLFEKFDPSKSVFDSENKFIKNSYF